MADVDRNNVFAGVARSKRGRDSKPVIVSRGSLIHRVRAITTATRMPMATVISL